MSAPRKLAAILAADVAGYSRLTGIDEEGTLKRLRKLRRELINPAISLHRGRIVKITATAFSSSSPRSWTLCAVLLMSSAEWMAEMRMCRPSNGSSCGPLSARLRRTDGNDSYQTLRPRSCRGDCHGTDNRPDRQADRRQLHPRPVALHQDD